MVKQLWITVLLSALVAAPSAGTVALTSAGTVVPTSAAGTVTMTSNNLGPVLVYTLSWISDGSGVVSGNPKSVTAGWIQSVEFLPDTGGTQPSNLYDGTLKNTSSADILSGAAVNLSNAIGVPFQFSTPYYFPGSGDLQTLDLGITNAGNAKTGKVKIYVERR